VIHQLRTDPDRNAYQAMLRSRVKGAIASALAASKISHQGLKGEVLEILISDLFIPLLPSDISVGSGLIVECEGGTLSNQVDLILYDKSILPPLLFNKRQGIFPIEAVLYAIEIKTTLTRAELEKSHSDAKKLNSFSYIASEEAAQQDPTKIERVRSVVFALKTDLASGGQSEIERYKDIYGEDQAFIRAICVVNQGYWYDDGKMWLNYRTSGEFDEVLAFIGGVTNTYRSIARSRGYPRLGNYVVPNDIVGLQVTAARPGQFVQVQLNVPKRSNPEGAEGDR
jgi:hypothetical protein